MLRDRVLSAVVLIPPIVLLAYWGGVWFLGLIMLLGALAGWEFYALVRRGVPRHCRGWAFWPSWSLSPVLIGRERRRCCPF
ncbi:MAG: hypothetical protein HZY76_10080 [Anaerolineae bacterium]|nr:MAG: hypothetical protein HZY76_10080 [Anaerolineae bacterium]